MANTRGPEVIATLDKFMETMFKLMMEHHQKQVMELELTIPQAQALRLLRRGPLCTGELAAELRISAPAVTQLTDRLTRKQLIERRTSDGDRRSVLVTLTDKGRRAVDRFRERRADIFSGALSRLEEGDRAHIVVALGKLIAALEEQEGEPSRGRQKASNEISRASKQVTRRQMERAS
jgi:DNA-binding MarR family transcriptional regulator